jgi:heat-inducible transcriptional repressor
MLSERQQRILRLVIDAYLDTGEPVSSKAIATTPGIEWSSSTVRSDLAALERRGYLTHPHTSAGRVPTESGYRFFADLLLAARKVPPKRAGGLVLRRMRREADEAMRETTSTLSRINDLLALATAPPPSTARIHRVEVLRLAQRVVLVIVIASNGAVSKRVLTFESEVDPGLVEWASSYLNERLGGLGLGARMIENRLRDPELSSAESAFVDELHPAFTGLEASGADALYVDGASRLLSEDHAADLPHLDELMGALERRVTLLGVLRSAIDERSVFCWIGEENPEPELRSVSVVGANYGLGYRNLGAVGVVGPLRMDYETAISSVRDAAGELSRFFETVYER